jgi:hypothetical protein
MKYCFHFFKGLPMKVFSALALAATLLAPLPALADGHAVATITIDGTLQYASIGQSVSVTEGENGAPDVIELGMVFVLVDADDPELTFNGVVNSNFVDNDTPTANWAVLLTE